MVKRIFVNGNFKMLLKHFCMEGTVLGLKYFYLYPDRVSRCFWAVTLILIAMFACCLTGLLYGRFNEMPTRITIENQYQPLDTLPFPAITICSPNQMTLSSMRHFNKTLIDGNTTVNLEKALPQLLGFYSSVPVIDDEELWRLQRLIDENRYTVPEVMGLMPQSCENFLKFCAFKLKKRPCSELFRPILTKQGLCCAFNSVYLFKDKRRNERDPHFKPHMATTRGIYDSLRVVVDYEPEDALPRTLFHVGAIRVMFTDWTEFPADDETNLVYPRVEAFLTIQGTYTYCSEEVTSLPPNSRECLFEDERRLQSFVDYHNSDCDHLCYIRAVEQHCHCKPVYVPYVGTQKSCDVTKIRCISKVPDLMSNNDGMVDCNCPRDCVSRMYTVDLSLGNLRALPHMVYNPYAGIVFNESTTILQFFFPTSVYVMKKQETVMSLISLVSNLGGIFGLCMGVSAVSVMEIMFYTRKAVENYLRKRLRRAVEDQVRQYRTRDY
ncbi:sodium channel protein Nach-like [Cydia amplana]|uniref:sodium channel protein Nach-like n=1 Tax=Cydia amplana TaxID=1869771 RepID=UPI002FE67CD2